MKKSLLKEFSNPGSDFRGAPFWSWSGDLDPDELRRQIRIMHRMGLGGFFMHSRVGLETEYLSEDWFNCIGACIDEAGKLNMNAWLYDEDRWPSGAAGGLVTKNPAYRQRMLGMQTITRIRDFSWESDTLSAFTATIDGLAARNVRGIAKGKTPARLAEGEVILRFRELIPGPSEWYNGQTYLDTLDHEAVREFIRVTHEAYAKRYGQHFAKTVPGIFTDEPNYGTRGDTKLERRLSWTRKMVVQFRTRYGYDITKHLVCLFFDVDTPECAKVRRDYYDCLTTLFVDAFARQIGEWCEEHHALHTGHVLCEDSPSSQMNAVGSAMRFYEHMQAPGMDLLSERGRVYDTAKQVASVARQFGRRWRLTETYGVTGWDFSFEGHKALGDWQAALGINLRCQHLSMYTMKGQAKRDYPASILHQSPWWREYSKVEDYFARIHAVMTHGREWRDVLVVHPIESAWVINPYDKAAQDENDQALIDLRDTLLNGNIDFDYGEEDIMARHARVTVRGGQPRLVVGKASYSVVVVPPMRTIRSSTLSLLTRFAHRGGVVVFAGSPAPLVDGMPGDGAEMLAACCVHVPRKGPRLLEAVEPGRILSICDVEGREVGQTLFLLREDTEAAYLFVVNTGHRDRALTRYAVWEDCMVRDRTAEISEAVIRGFSGFHGRPLELNPETGGVFAASSERTSDGWRIATSFPALGSRLFVVPRKKGTTAYRQQPVGRTVSAKRLKRKHWAISRSEKNVLVLDKPEFRIEGGAWRRVDDVLKVDYAVRDHLGIRRRGGQMKQPWAVEKPETPRRVAVELRYKFDVAVVPVSELFLVIEQPDTFRVQVNGVSVDMDADSGWWCDRAQRLIPVDANLLTCGANVLHVSCDYSECHSGLEIVYLLGEFGVAVRGQSMTLQSCPGTLRVGDWVAQGFPFYSGAMTYATRVSIRRPEQGRVVLRLPDYRGAAVKVWVNGRDAGLIAWAPNELDITDTIAADGVHDLRLEVFAHRRNSHGPLHHVRKWPTWTGPGEFAVAGKLWTDRYQLVPCGLLADPVVEVRR